MKANIGIVLAACLWSTFAYAETVSMYTWRAQEKALWEEISNRNLIPGIKIDHKVIRYEVHETYQPHILIEILHGKADVFQWSPGAAKLKPLIEKGFIVPNQADISNINKAALLASVGPDGQYYGVPFALQLQALIVNQKIFKKAGIRSQPRTLSEFNDALNHIKKFGVNPLHIPGAAGWLINQVIAEVMVAGLVDENFARGLTDGTSCFKDREYFQIFELALDWLENDFINPNWRNEGYSGQGTSFAIGTSALAFDGGWRAGPASVLWQMDPNFDLDFWAIPGKSNKVYGLGDGTYQVNHTSPRAKAAYKVLQYTTTKEFAELFAEHVKELPAYGGELSISDPLLNKMSQLLAENSYSVGMYSSYELNKTNPSYNALVAQAFVDVLNKEKTPQEAGEAIQKGLNEWGYVGHSNCSL